MLNEDFRIYADFNSIKVQLEHLGKLGKYYGSLTSFQFHKGTIRTQVLI